MAGRSAASHAGFLLPELRPGLSLLDCGCGPGVITVGLARIVAPGEVHGVDLFEEQFADAKRRAEDEGVAVTFRRASVYELPFEDDDFDVVFANALLEHLAEPVAALGEMRRVLRPAGVVGLCSPDWDGFILTPPSGDLDRALDTYRRLQRENGGNPLAGRFLGTWALEAGFGDVRVDARYERYDDPHRIAEYLAPQLDEPDPESARTLRTWAKEPGAMFAQAWVSVIASSNSQTRITRLDASRRHIRGNYDGASVKSQND
jgi:SAM-dependent methyltransferase